MSLSPPPSCVCAWWWWGGGEGRDRTIMKFIHIKFWPSGRVVDCNILIIFRHSTTGPKHPIYRTMRTVLKLE